MPELPEVETVRRVLEPHLLNRTIARATIHNAQVIASPSPEKFAALIEGQIITAFTRRGKFLRLLFESGDSLTIHLRMTGCLTIEPQTAPTEKHTHVIFSLDDGSELRYEDVRRLGKLWFARCGEEDTSGAKELGIEPFDGRAKGPSSPCCSTKTSSRASAISIRTKSFLPRASAPISRATPLRKATLSALHQLFPKD